MKFFNTKKYIASKEYNNIKVYCKCIKCSEFFPISSKRKALYCSAKCRMRNLRELKKLLD